MRVYLILDGKGKAVEAHTELDAAKQSARYRRDTLGLNVRLVASEKVDLVKKAIDGVNLCMSPNGARHILKWVNRPEVKTVNGATLVRLNNTYVSVD